MLLLVITWLLFSLFDLKHIYFGIFAILIVYSWCKNLFFVEKNNKKFYLLDINWIYFFGYIFWLLWQVFLANISVAKIILFKKEELDPGFITFDTKLQNPLAKSLLANSITLTPGTITLNVFRNSFEVHTLNERLAYLITVGELNRRIARVFGDMDE